MLQKWRAGHENFRHFVSVLQKARISLHRAIVLLGLDFERATDACFADPIDGVGVTTHQIIISSHLMQSAFLSKTKRYLFQVNQ